MKSYRLEKISINQMSLFVVMAIILIYPFVNVIDVYYEFHFSGKALFDSIIFLCIIALVVPHVIKIRYYLSDVYNHIFILSLTFLSILIYIFNNLDGQTITLVGAITPNRFVFMPYLIFILSIEKINSNKDLVRVCNVVVLSGVLSSLFRLINYYWFANYQIVLGHIITNGQRTRDLLQGSSVTTNMILVCFFVLVYSYRRQITRFSGLVYILYMILMFLAILTTGSRYPQFIGLLVFLYGVSFLSYTYKISYFLLAGIACLLIYLVGFNYPHVILRVLNDSGGRFDKLVLSLSIICTSVKSFLFGTSNNLIAVQRLPSGLQVSDNSYMLLPMTYGVPLAVTWFFYMGRLFKKYVKSSFLLFYSLYVLVGLGLTNCILWDNWVFMAIIGFVCMAHMDKYKTVMVRHETTS